MIEELNLTDIHTIHGRAEDFARQADYREQFDLCVSRAVANLSTLSEYCLPYVKVGGFFVSYKSGDIVDELSAAKTAVHVLEVHKINQLYSNFQAVISAVHL